MAINAQDILDTLANSVTYSTLTPGTAANAGGTAKGQEVNAYAKAMKIIKQNTTYINNQSGTNTAAGDAIEEIFYSHQYQAASPYSASGTGSYDGNVVEGNNTANGFNALFLSNAIDQFRQIDASGANPINAGSDVNASHFQLTQSQNSNIMTLTLLDGEGSAPTSTSGVTWQFRTRGDGTAAAGLKLGTSEAGRATAATTLTLDSGATLGMTNDIEASLYIYAINNGGTVELGIINGQKLDESVLHSSTILNASADSASTLYSNTARTTLAVRLIGRMRITMNAVGTYDEDPTELSVIGIGASGGGAGGELGSGEKIYWQDTNQYIQGDTTSITIESDDTLTINSDTLASINSDTKNQFTAPTTNVIASTTANVNSPIVYMTGNVAITHASDSHLAIGKNTWASGYQLDIQDNAPIFRMKSSDSADDNEAKRSRIIMEGDGGEEMFKIDTKHLGTGNDAASQVIFSNRGASSTTAFMTANSLQGVTFAANVAVTGHLSVSGTTTTINSTTLTVVDPLIELQTASGGGAIGSDTNKDVGLLMHYYSGSAKKAFLGWDDSAAKLTFVADATNSSEVISGTAGTILSNFQVPDSGTIGSASDSDSMTIASGGAVTFSQRDVHSAGITIADAGNIGSASDLDAIAIASGGAVTFSQRSVHSAGITIADAGQIGSASDADAIAIASTGVVTFSQSPVIGGATPKLTIGDAGAEDTMLVFDGNATDVRLGIDDSSDLFEIGTGATHATTPAITVDTSQNVNIVAHDAIDQGLKLAGTLVTSTAAEINLLDGGTSRGTTTVASGDGILINDDGTMRMTNVDTVSSYFASHSVGGGNIVTTGALNSGSITSDFGTIDTGSSTITTTGLISGGSLDIDHVLIDGTTIGHTDDTDLMTVADGALTLAGTLTVGVDNTGYDVKLFGATSGKYMLWDESADELMISGSIKFKEMAAAHADTTAWGQIWVKTAAPNQLWWTDDAGTDTQLGAAPSYYGGSVGTVALSIGQSPSTADTNTGLRSSAADHLEIVAGGADRLTANTTGVHVTALTETSYRELKENITPLEGSLDKIIALQGVNFDWKNGEEKQIGLLADDVAKVVPEVVQFTDKKATALQYSKMVALLIEGMKEQQNEIDELKKLVSKSK